MRRVTMTRLILLLVIFSLTATASPSYAFPYCPTPSCYYYIVQCREDYGGEPDYNQYWGWCDDGSGYLRGHGTVSCTVHGYTYEFGECADY